MKPSFNQLCEWEELNRQGLLPENLKEKFEQEQLQMQQVINASNLREALFKTKSQMQRVIDTSGLREVLSNVTAHLQQVIEENKHTFRIVALWYEKKKKYDELYEQEYPLGYYCFVDKINPDAFDNLKHLTFKKLSKYGVFYDDKKALYSKEYGYLPEDYFRDEYAKIYKEINYFYGLVPYKFAEEEYGLKCIKKIENLPERVRYRFRKKLKKTNNYLSIEDKAEIGFELEANSLSSDTLILSELIEVLEAIEDLPDKQLEAFKMIYFEGLTQAEASRLLGISQPSFKERLDNAEKTLRKKFQTNFVQ